MSRTGGNKADDRRGNIVTTGVPSPPRDETSPNRSWVNRSIVGIILVFDSTQGLVGLFASLVHRDAREAYYPVKSDL